MTTVALTAHFDGEKVQFDEPCQLDANARWWLLVLRPTTNARIGRDFQPGSWRSLRQQRAGIHRRRFSALESLEARAAIG